MAYIEVAIPRPIYRTFIYHYDGPKLEKASLVRVDFARKKTHAFFIRDVAADDEALRNLDPAKIKPVEEVIAVSSVFSKEVLKLIEWAIEYYQAPVGEAFHAAAPPAALGLKAKSARKKKSKESEADALNTDGELDLSKNIEPKRSITYNDEQLAALSNIDMSDSKAVLLHGITGSGKTEIYIECAKKALLSGKSVLILVPEIALTTHLHERLEAGLQTEVGLWHSSVASGVRKETYDDLRSGKCRVLLGARSAIFSPMTNLGLIVIDEEHDSTFKQEERFRYHARDLAFVRASNEKAKLILGSATPSLETLEKARCGRIQTILLTKRPLGTKEPVIDLVDLREEIWAEGVDTPFATRTVTEMQQIIDAGDQIIVFHNKRGFASFLVCEDCGWVTECPNCSLTTTYHRSKRILVCHQCGYKAGAPDSCEKCASIQLLPMGFGTERLEGDLQKLLPLARILRFDRDLITSHTRLEKTLKDFREGRYNILLGTQMVVKGHDFPNVKLVVVMLADQLFRFPEFRASEHAYQTLKQVAGRAGRREQQGRVLIQTYRPEHDVLAALASGEAEKSFLEKEREFRFELSYPPFSRTCRIRIHNSKKEDAALMADRLATALEAVALAGRVATGVAPGGATEISGKNAGEFNSSSTAGPDESRDGDDSVEKAAVDSVQILGPSEAVIEKIDQVFRYDLLLKSKSFTTLNPYVKRAKFFLEAEKAQFDIDVDPSA